MCDGRHIHDREVWHPSESTVIGALIIALIQEGILAMKFTRIFS